MVIVSSSGFCCERRARGYCQKLNQGRSELKLAWQSQSTSQSHLIFGYVLTYIKPFLYQTGWSPLHGATFSRHTEMILMLVSAGAKVNVVDKVHFRLPFFYTTCLHWYNFVVQEGNTPLHCAARDGSHSVIRTLLDLGADKGARNNVSALLNSCKSSRRY